MATNKPPSRDLGADVLRVVRYATNLQKQARAARELAPDTGSPSPSRWNPAKRADELDEIAAAIIHVAAVAGRYPGR